MIPSRLAWSSRCPTAPARWVFARELLSSGIDAPPWNGDVRIVPEPGLAHTRILLRGRTVRSPSCAWRPHRCTTSRPAATPRCPQARRTARRPWATDCTALWSGNGTHPVCEPQRRTCECGTGGRMGPPSLPGFGRPSHDKELRHPCGA
ncbi:SsgA family sporulation/cell division regulator [Kitasatospora acidiphila]|uniref:SsgA family sporulation/cell division regulator n=1 Tax=Kitasatospora acidiphila TaxID=2567942 RepID=UPI003C7274A8